MASLVCHLSGSAKEHLHQLRYQSEIQKQSHRVTGREEHSKKEKKNSEPSMGSNRLKADKGLFIHSFRKLHRLRPSIMLGSVSLCISLVISLLIH